VLRANDTVLQSNTFLSGVWSGLQTFTARSFTYVGDGSGDVRLRVRTVNQGVGRFGGAIDDLSIY